MYRDDHSPLADWIIDAYEMIASEIGAQEDDQRFDTERAHDLLVAEGHDRMDAEYAIQRLLDRGYLYSVEGDLFVTEPDHSTDD